jgi:hypothetical protein
VNTEYVTIKFGPNQKYELHLPVAPRDNMAALRQSLLDCFSELCAKIDGNDPKQLKFKWPDAA